MDYAAAVNEEIKDLFAAGADIVQIDEPYMQARPEKARPMGWQALNRALDGVDRHDRGAYLLRLCRDHPRAARRAIPSCRELANCPCNADLDRDRAVQARLLGAGEAAAARPSSSACSTCRTMTSRRPRRSPPASAARCRTVAPRTDHRRARLRPEIPAARGRLRQDEGDGGRRGARARGAGRRLTRQDTSPGDGAGPGVSPSCPRRRPGTPCSAPRSPRSSDRARAASRPARPR